MRRLPVRWRLTLWYAALVAAAMLLFGIGLYLVYRYRLSTGLDEQIRSQAAVALARIRVENDRPTLDLDTISDPGGDYFVRLRDAEGIVVDTDEEVPQGTAAGAIDAALAGQTGFATVAVPADPVGAGTDELRVLTMPVRGDNGRVIGTLQVGQDLGDIKDTLAQLLRVLGLAAPVVLLFSAAGGYVMAGRVLAPVTTITRLAAGIGGDDLATRLDLDLPDDELGRLARTFDAMLARIEDAFERQRRFTGDAAHELRTPLSLMRSQVDLALARPRSAEEYREALRGLDGDLERLTGLVGTLLTLARADAGLLPLECAPFDLAETVAATLEQHAPVAAEAGVALRDEASPTPLVADEDRLVQVLVNLIDNALAHTPTGGTVIVGCRRDGASARLWVADTGDGIAPQEQARVFDRFYRIDVGRARERGGAGLGLAICRAIAEAHGGRIGLTSRLGHGTRVELVLPSRA